MAAGRLSDINITPLVDILLVLLIIFMVTTAASEQERLEQKKQESVQEKTESLVSLNLPITPDNDYRADPNTTKLVVVIDKNLRVFVIRGLSNVGAQDPIADCSKTRDPAQWQPCFDIITNTFNPVNPDTNRREMNKRLKDEGLYLEADADAPYGFVSGVLQALRVMGLQSVDIVTDPNFASVLEADHE